MTFAPIKHIALTVRDLEVSAPWYQVLIGTDPVHDEHTDGGFHHVVWQLGTGTLISIHQHDRSTDGERFSEVRAGLDHWATLGSGARIAPNSRRGRRGWRNSGSNTAASSTRATDQA